MSAAHAPRDKHLDRLAEQLLAGIPEQPFRFVVDEHDLAAAGGHDHAAPRRLDAGAEARVCLRARRNIDDRSEHERAVILMDRIESDLDRNALAALVPAEELTTRAHAADLGVREKHGAILLVVPALLGREARIDLLSGRSGER